MKQRGIIRMVKKSREFKKVIIFIVEGNSDKKALEKIFQKIYRNKDIVFKFTDGDITSDENMTGAKAVEKIYNKVEEYMKDKKLLRQHIWQIVHIFDTDGTFIPDTAVVKGGTAQLVYTPTQICCKNVQKVLERNERKSKLMDYLLRLKDIKNIPYVGFFMSSNLDHALYDEQNLSQELKGEYADAFYTVFSGREELFIDFLEDEVSNGVPDSFPSSWRYIKDGLHSLERHTNLHIYFKLNPYRL